MIMMRFTIVLLVCIGIGEVTVPRPLQAQNVAKYTSYDTVSVRENKSPTFASGFHPSPNGLSMTNVTVPQIFILAFGPIDRRSISGLPAWTNSKRYDISEKLDDETFSAFQKLPPAEAMEHRKLMMQQILFDRFNLKMHHDKRDAAVFALVVAKGGPKLKEADQHMINNPGGEYHRGQLKVLDGEISGQAISLDRLARALATLLDREIVDQTGLLGKYDVALKWLPVRSSQDQADADAQSSHASIFSAVHEQLGLRLEATRALTDSIVVDHIEMPNDN